MKLKFIKQRWEKEEAIIILNDGRTVLAGFILEYYLVHNLYLSKRYKNKSPTGCTNYRNYCKELFNLFKSLTNNGLNFNYSGFMEWSNSSNPELQEVIKEFRKLAI